MEAFLDHVRCQHGINVRRGQVGGLVPCVDEWMDR